MARYCHLVTHPEFQKEITVRPVDMKMTKETRAAITYVVMVSLFYLIDCFIAHPTHPGVRWIASGVFAGGLFGFVATVAAAIAGIVYLAKKNY